MVRASSFPMVLDGMGPTSPTPGSRRVSTLVPSRVQVMPTQDMHAGVERVQLSFLPWGTAPAKSRSACLSEFLRSAIAKGRRVIMAKNLKHERKMKQNFIGSFCSGICLATKGDE